MNPVIRTSAPQEISNGIETEPVSESPQSIGGVPGGTGQGEREKNPACLMCGRAL